MMRIEKEINMRELFVVIRKRLWIALLCVALFTAFGFMYISQPVTPLYEASTRIYLQAHPDLLNTLRVVLREPFVLNEVIEQLELPRTAESLREQIQIDSVGGSSVLIIRVIDRDQQTAVHIANSIVKAFNTVAANTVFFTHIIVLTEAVAKPNPQPINNPSKRPLMISIVIGFMIGIGLIYVIDSLDDTIRSEKDIEQILGITVLGYVNKIKKNDISKKAIKQRHLSLRGETIGS